MTVATSARPVTNTHRLVSAVARFREAGIVVVLLLIMLITALRSDSFLTASNLRGIALDIAILVVLAVGETVVVLTRNIDISVGSILGFSALFVGVVLKDHPHTPILAIMLLGIAVGMVLGAGNALLVAVLRVPAIIATLGTLGIYRGLVVAYSNAIGQQEVTAANLPNNFLDFASQTVLGVPIFDALPVLVVIVAAYWLRQTRSGREVYAVGDNPEAARLAGIPTARIVFTAFVLSGALAGLGGVLYTARFAQVDSSAGLGLELTVVAAVVIGGTSTLGGVGGVLGTLIGCILLGTINNSLILLSNPGTAQFWQRAVYGVIFLAAIVVDAVVSRQLARALRRRRL
jgi:rhamnose transport system permease protein